MTSFLYVTVFLATFQYTNPHTTLAGLIVQRAGSEESDSAREPLSNAHSSAVLGRVSRSVTCDLRDTWALRSAFSCSCAFALELMKSECSSSQRMREI